MRCFIEHSADGITILIRVQLLRHSGHELGVTSVAARGHPIFETRVQIPRGQTAEVKYEFLEPTAAGAPRVPIQPLLDNITLVVSVPECAG